MFFLDALGFRCGRRGCLNAGALARPGVAGVRLRLADHSQEASSHTYAGSSPGSPHVKERTMTLPIPESS